MDNLGLIAGIIIMVASAIIIAIMVFKHKKETGDSISFDEFVKLYGNRIVQVLIDVIQLLKLDHGDYEDRGDYEYTVISNAIDKLKTNSAEFGIDSDVIKMIDTDTLTDIVQKILHNEVMDIFNDSINFVNIGNESIDEEDQYDENVTSSSIETECPYTDEMKCE